MKQILRTKDQIGGALRNRRRELGMNQAAVGEMANLRQATISRAETGDESIHLGTLCDILAALDLELVVQPRTKGSLETFEELF